MNATQEQYETEIESDEEPEPYFRGILNNREIRMLYEVHDACVKWLDARGLMNKPFNFGGAR